MMGERTVMQEALFYHWVDIVDQLGQCLVALLARLLQADVGKAAE